MAISNASNSESARKRKLTVASVFATLILLFSPSAASADTAWRYWSYWVESEGTWELAMTGAADIEATDGSVQGWRYITAGLEVGDQLAPRIPAIFDDICADTPQSESSARVAVVIDFGDETDYSDNVTIPETITECVVVPTGSPSTLLLPEIAEIREDSGLVCAVNGLPANGCGEEVEITSDEPTLISEPLENEASNILENPLFLAGLALAVAALAFLGLKKKS